MKVKDLIKELEKLEQDTRIIISADEEGNYFGDIASDFGEHFIDKKMVYAIYPESNISADEVLGELD